MIDSKVADEAYSGFQLGLKHLTYDVGDKQLSKACLICDRLLEWNDSDVISSSRLEALSCRLRGETSLFSTIDQRVKEKLKSEYTYRRQGRQSWMDAMYLSPRGYYQANKAGFQCCKICTATLNTKERPVRIKLPRFAIANGCLFGKAPLELTILNDVELALVSLARTNKHVFSFYGGAHKSMRGWHNLYDNDVEGIARTINQASTYGGQNTIVCLLLGPFTPLQKQYVKNKMSVRVDRVLQAFRWLRENNHLYKDIRIPNANEVENQVPIIDETENAESTDSNIESRMEYTVVFPGTNSASPLNGGCMNQQAFLSEVINAMDTTTETSVISRPTQHRLIDYEGDALLRAFPLQFPFGVGLPPERPTNRRDKKDVAVSKLSYLQHLQHLSISVFHRSEFILVLHNMYEKQRAVSVSYLRSINKIGEDSLAERISEITVEKLQSGISRIQAGLSVPDQTVRDFITSVDAVCKSMGHTNDAAKSARLKMLSDAVRFGTSAVFFTVTPDDNNCLRIQVYAQHESKRPPHFMQSSDEEVMADYDLSVKVRQDFPGLCAFDFQQINELFIEWILGWDRKKQTSYPNGGAFGILDAWNAAVEEQGRKTLHSHWLLYVRDWSDLLCGLYSESITVRQKSAKKLHDYIESIISTKLFGLRNSLAKQAHKHDCVVTNPPVPTLCENQDLRNLRYKHGESKFKKDNILMCDECKKTFTSQELVDKVLQNWFGNCEITAYRMRLMVKDYSNNRTVRNSREKLLYEFTIQALANLHASCHVNTCFKKGFECRSKLPQKPCPSTGVHFYEDSPMHWWSWFGEMKVREPFMIEAKRHKFDVFMNQYHSRLSSILGCNTNVQCGMGGGSVMYMTYYASKSTQSEDRYAYSRVAKTIYKRIRRTEEHTADGIEMDSPFTEGFRRLLSAVLSHTESTVVSGPMAWFIMRNESRFLFSHDHAHLSCKKLLGGYASARINNIGSNAFVWNPIHDYVYRPRELEKLNLYDFVAGYVVKPISGRNEDVIMRFASKDHPRHNMQGMCERTNSATPLLSFLDFPNSFEFGGNILDANVETNPAMEKYAKTALCLFVPFRDEEQFDDTNQDKSYVKQLQEAMSADALSAESLTRLQNIQNCHNMMKVGRPDDVLERITHALPDPINCQQHDHDAETQTELENHIELHLTELMADLDADNAMDNSNPQFSLNEFRKNGKDNCGFKGIRANGVDVNSCVFTMHNSNVETQILLRNNDSGETPEINQTTLPDPISTQPNQTMTKARLTALSIDVVRRHVQDMDEVLDVNPNGTTESIRSWSERMFIDRETNMIDSSQQRAFQVIVSMFVLTFHEEAERNEGQPNIGTQDPRNRNKYHKLLRELKKLSGMKKSRQLILFMTGAGGSGKTRVVNAVMAYAKGFCKALNYMFDKRMIVLTALTGVAATLISGETIHSAAKLNFKQIKAEHIEEWKHARLIIIDEISFASKADLEKLNTKLQDLTETISQKYGNLHVAFLGDFSQLHPVSGNPLFYETNFAMWHDWVNCFIELTGQHRFKRDPNYGAMMKRMHDGNTTNDDIDVLNSRVIGGDHPDAPTMADIPEDVAYAAYRNVDKTAINNGVFAEHIKKTHSTNPLNPPPFHTLIVRSDDLTWKSNKRAFGKNARHTLWSECSDCDIKTIGDNGKFVDTFLKLCTRIPLMYTENHDVSNGIANGTLCYLLKVVLHVNVTINDFSFTNVDGYYVRTIDASKVDYLLCQIDVSNKTIKVQADHVSCKIDFPIQLIPGQRIRKIVRAKVNRFPVVVNHATTGHKLQGQTKESLFISDWHYGSNWPYVVLSRVTTLKGLFLLKPLKRDVDFSQDGRLERMLARFRNKAPDEYDSE